MRAAWALLALLVPALAGCTAPPAMPDPGPGEQPPGDGGTAGSAPAWSFTDTQGQVHSDETARGNVSMLFFMATWCGSCRRASPMLAEVVEDYAGRGLQAFGLSIERGDSDEELEQWKAQYGHAWPYGRDERFEAARTFEIVAQSSVVVLDAEGHVVQKWGYGQVREAELRAALDRAVGAKGAQGAA